MYKFVLSFMLMLSITYAKGGVDIAKIIKPYFSSTSVVTKKAFTLNTLEVTEVQQQSKARLSSPIIRMYTVKNTSKIEGHAVLIIQKIRTKKAAILYVMDRDEKIISIEILAFNEPSEYKPNKAWQEVFEGKTKDDNLFSGKGIPTISGATLSARAISDASRIALSIVQRYK